MLTQPILTPAPAQPLRLLPSRFTAGERLEDFCEELTTPTEKTKKDTDMGSCPKK